MAVLGISKGIDMLMLVKGKYLSLYMNNCQWYVRGSLMRTSVLQESFTLQK